MCESRGLPEPHCQATVPPSELLHVGFQFQDLLLLLISGRLGGFQLFLLISHLLLALRMPVLANLLGILDRLVLGYLTVLS